MRVRRISRERVILIRELLHARRNEQVARRLRLWVKRFVQGWGVAHKLLEAAYDLEDAVKGDAP